MEMQPEEDSGAPRPALLALGAVLVIGVLAIGSVFVFRLQPPLGGTGTSITTHQGEVIVVLPSGVSSNLNLNFNPGTIKVVVGVNNTVTWVNQDTAIHTVTEVVSSGSPSFNSGDLKSGDSFTHVFGTPGTYNYVCVYHSVWMKGTVVVTAGS